MRAAGQGQAHGRPLEHAPSQWAALGCLRRRLTVPNGNASARRQATAGDARRTIPPGSRSFKMCTAREGCWHGSAHTF